MFKLLCCFFLVLLIFGCKKETTSEAVGVEAVKVCSTTGLESSMTATLGAVVTDTDFALQVERSDGRIFSFNRGAATPQTTFESASTSKLVTSVIILRLIDQGYLNLSDKPQTHISNWTIPSTDPLFNLNLSQLLSFTSGLVTEPACLNLGGFDFEACVKNIGTINSGNSKLPGAEFYYSSTHMQVAGLMAIKARGVASWQNIFSEFKTQTGLFPSALFDLPSATNPRLAGGMHWKGEEYLNFLRALKNGTLLSANLQAQLILDQTAGKVFGYSPAVSALNEQWHYGLGIWHECKNSAVYNCTPGTRMSSPGTYGAYPFWDRQRNYIGMISRQGGGSTFRNGADLENSVRSVLDEWATCPN